MGKIVAALFRGNPSEITVIYQSGDERRYRIIESTLQSPALINYIPANFDQAVDFFGSEEAGKEALDAFAVKEIRFSNKIPFFYKKNIVIEWFYAAED